MKILSVILTLYIVFLSTYPCCDEEGIFSKDLTEYSVHDTKDDCTDSCSPFFACESCTVITFPVTHSSVDPPVVLYDCEEPCFSVSVYNEYTDKIWQPPRTS